MRKKLLLWVIIDKLIRQMLTFYLTNMIYQGNILHLGNIFINLYFLKCRTGFNRLWCKYISVASLRCKMVQGSKVLLIDLKIINNRVSFIFPSVSPRAFQPDASRTEKNRLICFTSSKIRDRYVIRYRCGHARVQETHWERRWNEMFVTRIKQEIQ